LHCSAALEVIQRRNAWEVFVMNRVTFIRRTAVLAALVFWACTTAWAMDGNDGEDEVKHEDGGEDKETLEFAFTPGSLLEIDLEGGGSTFVTGWDREGAQVTYFDTERDVEDHRVKLDAKDGGLRITTERIRERNVSQALTFEIRVPHRVELEFYSGGGELELADLEGTFEGRTLGGSLTLTGLTGRARLETAGGPIVVGDCSLDGKLSTGGGPVVLENVVGNLEATSGGGNVQYKNVRDRDGRLRAPGDLPSDGMTEETVVITTAGGPIQVRRAPAGAHLRTNGGDISVNDAAQFVTAWTGGGDISIQIENGWVEAQTGAGDIDVEVLGGLGDGRQGIDAWTGLGEITVTLPAGISAELDLEIAYTRNSCRDCEIDSDVKVDIERSEEWDYDHGSPRKYIRGTATIGDGQHRIKINTVNGNIRIRTGE
jgi:DUF4097 and DUF4098 domain-containing protein YvlB